MQIKWLGHGTFHLTLSSGQVILVDPWVGGNPACPENCKTFSRIDTLLITHGHFDHIAEAVELAKKHSPKVVGIYELCAWLQSKGVENTCAMNKGGSQQVGDARITMVHADHSCGILDDGKIIYGGEAVGYVVNADGRTFYFSGDTNVFGDMKLIGELYHPQLAFLPIGDLFTMGPMEAATACRLLGIKKLIPMHFGTFSALTGTPASLEQELKGSGIEMQVLSPGQSVTW